MDKDELEYPTEHNSVMFTNSQLNILREFFTEISAEAGLGFYELLENRLSPQESADLQQILNFVPPSVDDGRYSLSDY